MIDFIEYVVSELKSKRISRHNAVALMQQFAAKDGGTGTVIHPLLHTNISDLSQQTYQSVFTGQEHFLADHKVKTSEDNFSAVLPGAAYLEMVQTAVRDALPDADDTCTIQLQNVVWAAPVVVTEKTEVFLTLIPEDAEPCMSVDFEVYSVTEQGDETIHCQGQAILNELEDAPAISLDTISGRINPNKVSADIIYDLFRQLGLDYGGAHQPITSLQQGDGEVLAQLQLPEPLLAGFDKFLLHPSLIDGALQTSVGLQGDLVPENSKPSLPFALGQLTVYSDTPANCYAWVRYAQGSGDNDALVKLDIDLVDESGQVCVSLREFTARVLSQAAGSNPEPQMLLAAPHWQEWNKGQQGNEEQKAELSEHWHIAALEAKTSWTLSENTTMFNVPGSKDFAADEFESVVQEVFAHCKKLIEDSASDGIKLQLLVPESLQNTGLVALNGLLLSVVAESPQSVLQLLLVAEGLATDVVQTAMAKLQQSEQSGLYKLATSSDDANNGQIKALQWQSQSADEADETIYKDNGVYVITGASGALGQVFLESVLQQTQYATVAALGRGESASFMDDLPSDYQNRVFYYQADLNNQAKLNTLIADISIRHGAISGVLHIAGMTDDNFLRNKTAEQISQVLAPKVEGTVNLDLATAKEPLDFFAMFSSMVAVTGNTGQADYAAANGFMDQFASYRQGLCEQQQRQGKSLSVNWPYWQTGGMTLDADTLEAMRQATGLVPMPAQTGVAALTQCLQLAGTQQLVAWGDKKRVLGLLNQEPVAPKAKAKAPTAPAPAPVKEAPKEVAAAKSAATASASQQVAVDDTTQANSEEAFKNKTLAFLREQFSSLLKLPPHRIEVNAPLENYGIDSVLAMNLTRLLEETFGSLSKTLFFEYQTIDELTTYFIKKHKDVLIGIFGEDTTPVASNDASQAQEASKSDEPATNTKPAATKGIKAPRRRGTSVKRRASASTGVVASQSGQQVSSEPIAIVGMSGRYPESPDLEAFWENLRNGKDCVVEVPESRWDWKEFYTQDRTVEGGHYSKWGGFIVGVDEFDPRFFNISPRDAVFMDPQERLFLQQSWHALEDAGLTRQSLRKASNQEDSPGQVGVYAGVMYGEYNRSGSLATIANRVSYVMDLHGPSMTLDTMCSSSLTAIHLACEDLKLGRTDAALAGGVNISIHPGKYTILSAGQFISGDGHCQSFGEGGDGYIPGEGAGVVLLKRLSDAKRDGHHIYALISGSALNHGGKTNGYTVPNPHAQASVISRALEQAGRSADTVSYIEAHGTGTSLGDPIEITALNNAFTDMANGAELPAGSCAIGSAKSNIGHCESAAGIAGLAKLVLQLQHKQIVPSLHSKVLNPHINFEQTPFEVNQELRPWPAKDGLPRIAGISSFGAGGSNAHIVVEEYVEKAATSDLQLPQVVVPISARTPAQLEQKVSDLLSFLDKRCGKDTGEDSDQNNQEQISLSSLGYTLQIGREPMDERVAFWVQDLNELRQALKAFIQSPNEQSWDYAIFRDSIKGHKDTIGLLRDDRDFLVALRNWLQQGKLEKVLEFWVKGLTPDWLQLYTEQQLAQLRRINLPSYPFARESYWMDLATTGPLAVRSINGKKATSGADAVDSSTASQSVSVKPTNGPYPESSVGAGHALLHENFSSLGRQRYRSHFLAEHPLMTSGVVKGQLASASLLAMALAAAEKATDDESGQKLLQLQDMAFGMPYGHQAGALNLEMAAIAGLSDSHTQNLAFDIYSSGSQSNATDNIHAQGLFRVVTTGDNRPSLAAQQNPKTVNVSPHSAWQNVTIDHSSLQAQLATDGTPEELVLNSVFELLTSVIAPQQAYGLKLIAQGDFYQSLDKVVIAQWIAGPNYFAKLLAGTSAGPLADGEFELRLFDAQGQLCAHLMGVSFLAVSSVQASQNVSTVTSAATPASANATTVIATVTAAQVVSGPVLAKPDNIQLVGLQEISSAAIAPRPVTRLTQSASVALTSVESTVESAVATDVTSLSNSSIPDDILALEQQDNAVSAQVTTPVVGKQTLPEVANTLTVSLAQALFMEPEEIDPDTSFIDLGLDSIIGVEWVKDINKAFGTDISATRVYDFSTINALTAFVHEQLPEVSSDAAVTPAPAPAPVELAPAPVITPSAVAIDLPPELEEEAPAPASAPTTISQAATNQVAPHEVEAKLAESLAQALFLEVDDIEGDASFIDLGLDSIIGVEWVNSINKLFGLNISATRVYDYANLNALTGYVVSELQKVAPAGASAPVEAAIVEPAPVSPVVAQPITIETAPVETAPVETAPVEPVTAQPQSASVAPAEVEAKLTESLAQALFLDVADIEGDASFIDLGLDSIIGVEWVNSINKLFGLNISATRVYDYANLNALTGYVVSELEKVAPAVSAPAASASVSEPVAHVTKAAPAPAPVLTSASAPTSGASSASHTQVVYPNLVRRLTVGESIVPEVTQASAQHVDTQPSQVRDVIAVVGMSGRYPDAADLDTYWENIIAGKNSVIEIPKSRWDVERYYDPDPTKPGKVYAKWLGMLQDAEMFDPLFFQIPPSEARSMDPQHRLFLQEGYHAFEDAGYSAESLSETRCGVYVGIMSSEYAMLLAKDTSLSVDTTANSFAIGSARLAYHLNLKGPAIPIDTACSSSLVAMHLAGQALQNNEIDMALAGGVSLYLTAESYLGMCQAGMLSAEGQCKAFDNSADGFVPGEGVGAVVLKRLSDAQNDGDNIYGVICASGINQDGKTNGITAPSVNSQIALERELYNRYEIDPLSINYVEAHGTGTKLGDPIELEALGTVYGEKTSRKNFCALGSVKSNLGHTSGAAGVASVHKVLLSMQNEQICPTLHVKKENQFFNFDNSPFYISKQAQPWPKPATGNRRAAVSSFGFSGTNAHLVLEQYIPQPQNTSPATGPVLIPISARTEGQLQQVVEQLLAHLDGKSEISLHNLAFTLQVGRTGLAERLILIASSMEQFIQKLKRWLAGESVVEVWRDKVTRDKQTLSLFNQDPEFRAKVDNWLAAADYHNIAQYWVQGLQLDWQQLKRATKLQRISLPGYPFAKQRFWVDLPEHTDVAAAPVVNKQVASSQMSSEIATEPATAHIFVPQWQVDESFTPVANTKADSGSQSKLLTINAPQSLSGLPENQAISAAQIANTEKASALAEDIVKQQVKQLQVLFFNSDSNAIPVLPLFYLAQGLQQAKFKGKVTILAVNTDKSSFAQSAWQALSGFGKSLAMENPAYRLKTLSFDASLLENAKLAQALLTELNDTNERFSELRYQLVDGKAESIERSYQSYGVAAESNQPQGQLPFKQGGTYIITGGLGGLGVVMARYLVERYHAKLVLSGRSENNQSVQQKVQQLFIDSIGSDKDFADKALYVSADVTDAKQVEKLVAQAKDKFNRIDGVLHCAGFNNDAFVLNKSDTEFSDVLAPKIQGTVNLDAALADEQLDLFILFSSVAGAMGNPGQCDYAYANRFMDVFAQKRQSQCENGSRFGQNLSVNWPLWRDGGMSISDSDVEITKSRTGMEPLPTDAGIQSLEFLLSKPYNNALVLFGQSSKIKQYVLGQSSDVTETSASKAASSAALSGDKKLDEQQLLSATVELLSDIISTELKISPEDFDSQERFENYGIDSIVIGRLNLVLENALGELSKTLFYEYETTEELAEYLALSMGEPLQVLFAQNQGGQQADVHTATASKVVVEHTLSQSVEHKVEAKPESKIAANEGIAIVGIHGYFPQSDSVDGYWNNLKSGKDLIELVPENRWDQEALFDADPMNAHDGKIYCKWGSFLDNFDQFDAPFFNIHKAEAAVIDPQERLFLQSVWSAIEDAGYTRQKIQQSYASHANASLGVTKASGAEVGVFVGVTSNTYQLLAPQEWAKGNSVTASSLPWSIANRVSYFFDFAGPSMPIDTSCSSSLVAVHMACDSLRSGDCQLAVAGGVNLYLHPAKYQSMCARSMLAQHGKNRSFGAGDNGFVPGEGVGAMILKPVSKASKDGDNIYGVITGSACAHSGRSNGYSAPNPHAQAKVIADALQKSGITGADIGYVEGHGTGTQLGDNLEVVALKQAFGKNIKAQSCALGSVKANMGHAESAAGVAGIIKLLMQIKHKHIVPGLHANPVNPDIDFDNSPFYLSDSLHQWHVPKGIPRRGLINGFGAGGVNAAVVIEEYLPEQQIQPQAQPQQGQTLLFPVSAQSEGQLRRYVQLLLSRIQGKDAPSLASLAYTLQTGREAMTWRLAILASDVNQLRQELLQWLRKQDSKQCFMDAIPTDKLRSKAYRQQLQQETEQALQNQDLPELAKLWLQGAELKWEEQWDEQWEEQAQLKVSLPTYPFATERHWVEISSASTAPASTASTSTAPARLHPLLSYNASTLKTVSFISELDSNAFYATEHKVNDALVLPGTAYLEIANIAGTIAGEQKVKRISDLVWAMPLVFGEGEDTAPAQLQTFLKTIGDATEFEVTSIDAISGRQMHCEGRLFFNDSLLAHNLIEPEVQSLDPKLMLQTMTQQGASTLNHQQLYDKFAQTGLHYGQAFSTIQQLHSSEDKALARWLLPASLLPDFADYLLHPAILDGVLQSIVGIGSDDASSTPYLPFAIGQLDILRPMSMSGYTIVEQVPDKRSSSIGSEIKKFNITVTDDVGQVLLTIADFCVRALPAAASLAATDNQAG